MEKSSGFDFRNAQEFRLPLQPFQRLYRLLQACPDVVARGVRLHVANAGGLEGKRFDVFRHGLEAPGDRQHRCNDGCATASTVDLLQNCLQLVHGVADATGLEILPSLLDV